MISNGSPSRSTTRLMGSRVVPGTSDTRTRSSPASLFSSVDLPTLGRPTMARRGNGVSASPLDPASGNASTRRSRKSPVLRPWRALTGIGSPRPSAHRWSSVELAASGRRPCWRRTDTGTSLRCSSRATPLSSSVNLGGGVGHEHHEVGPADGDLGLLPDVGGELFVRARNSQPPVSITRNAFPFHSASNSRRSLVTPACSSTTAALRRRMRLTSVDLPTLGRPTTATTGSRLMRRPPRSGPARSLRRRATGALATAATSSSETSSRKTSPDSATSGSR